MCMLMDKKLLEKSEQSKLRPEYEKAFRKILKEDDDLLKKLAEY